MLTTPPQPRLTGGTDRPETPCTRDLETRLAALRLTGEYPPSPFDLAIEYQNARGWRYRQAVSEAQTICARCPVWELCLRENRDADGVIAGLTLQERIGRKPPTRRKGCGKAHGASNHSRAGEYACEDCKAAQAKAQRDRKRREVAA